MAGYMVYWPGEQIRKLKKAKDTGPIRVVLGSVHAKMPSIAGVKPGDVIYLVTLEKGTLYAMARLPVERVEPAYDYLLRETGDRHAALIPKDAAYEERPSWFISGSGYYNSREEIPPEVTRITCLPDQKPVPHLCHQEPFNCCSETAASGPGGSAIEARPIPAEQVDGFRFGSVKSKQKPLKRNGKGELTTLSLSGFTRKMSDDTRAYFDSLFDDAT